MRFKPDEELSVVPVWVSFPGLPANLFHEAFIKSIAGNVGRVLKVALSTSQITNAAEALACVEIDVLKPRAHRIWIDLDGEGDWFPIKYMKVPAFCVGCRKIGHDVSSCRSKKPGASLSLENSGPAQMQHDPIPIKNTTAAGKEQQKQSVSKTNEAVLIRKTTSAWIPIQKGKRKEVTIGSSSQNNSDLSKSLQTKWFHILSTDDGANGERATQDNHLPGGAQEPLSAVENIDVSADDDGSHLGREAAEAALREF